jgi:transposase-like protein
LEILPDGSDVLGGACMNTHRSTPKQRVEVITRGAPRNWWPEEKREIVLASLEPVAWRQRSAGDLSPNVPPLKSRFRCCRHAHRDGVSLFV